jgi:hypothetical protein
MIDWIGVVLAGFIRNRRGCLESGVVGDIDAETKRKALALEMVARHAELRVKFHCLDRLRSA